MKRFGYNFEKLFFVLKNKEYKENINSIFDFSLFFVLKNMKNIKFR